LREFKAGHFERFGDINIRAVVQDSSYLISKAPRHRSTTIPSCADEMPLNIMSITAVFDNLEVVCLMNLVYMDDYWMKKFIFPYI